MIRCRHSTGDVDRRVRSTLRWQVVCLNPANDDYEQHPKVTHQGSTCVQFDLQPSRASGGRRLDASVPPTSRELFSLTTCATILVEGVLSEEKNEGILHAQKIGSARFRARLE